MTDTATQEAPAAPRRTMTPEHKAKMAAARTRAAAERRAMPELAPRPTIRRESQLPPAKVEGEDYLLGLTSQDCPVGCTPECCVITGKRYVREQLQDSNREYVVDQHNRPVYGEPFFTTYCGHPNRSGLQAAEKMRPDVLRRYNDAKRKLAHLAVDKKVV